MKMKKGAKIAIGIASVFVIIIAAVLIMFQGELRTLLSVKEELKPSDNSATGMYVVNYSADYKLDRLLEEGGAATEDQLVQYILRTMLKGLPIEVPYEIPDLGCSTFVGANKENGYLFGRNFDNQETDFAVVKTNPRDGYSSVSCVSLSFLGYNEENKPDKIASRINLLALPYFPLDGVNEKGLAVGVLQLQAPPTKQDNGKTDVGTTLAIRAILDKCATVREAVSFLEDVDMHAAANGCYHFQIADATGDSVVVSYVGNDMIVTEKTDGILCATNFYLHDVPFEYKKEGLDRYEGLTETLSEKDSYFEKNDEMSLLEKVCLTGTDPDEKGRVYSTQWSSIYDLEKPALNIAVDRDYKNIYTYSVD